MNLGMNLQWLELNENEYFNELCSNLEFFSAKG
jgi:hypothetical protein